MFKSYNDMSRKKMSSKIKPRRSHNNNVMFERYYALAAKLFVYRDLI